MKALKILVGICMVALIFSCATTKKETVVEVAKQPSTDEVIKPHITIDDLMADNWENIATEPYPGNGYIDFFLTNKDPNAEIQWAVVRFVPQYSMVLGYAYMFEDQIYVFQMNEEGDYELADLRDSDVEWWISQFKKHFFGNLETV